jgi:hypothetical protein
MNQMSAEECYEMRVLGRALSVSSSANSLSEIDEDELSDEDEDEFESEMLDSTGYTKQARESTRQSTR